MELLQGPFKVLAAKVSVVILLVLVALAFGAYAYHNGVVTSMEKDIADLKFEKENLRTDNVSLKESVYNLGQSVERSNTAVRDMKTAQAESKAASEEALKRVSAESAKWKGKYEGIFNAPRSSPNECTAFKSLLQEYVDLRKKENSNAESPESPAGTGRTSLARSVP